MCSTKRIAAAAASHSSRSEGPRPARPVVDRHGAALIGCFDLDGFQLRASQNILINNEQHLDPSYRIGIGILTSCRNRMSTSKKSVATWRTRFPKNTSTETDRFVAPHFLHFSSPQKSDVRLFRVSTYMRGPVGTRVGLEANPLTVNILNPKIL